MPYSGIKGGNTHHSQRHLDMAVLTVPRKEVKLRQNHKWTDDERDIIRRDYKHTHKSRQELAARLGVTEYGVAGKSLIPETPAGAGGV